MSDSPIFNQLNAEFTVKDKSYDDLVNWSVPEFVWDPTRPVVQLDRQTPRGVKFAKVMTLSDTFDREARSDASEIKLGDVSHVVDVNYASGLVEHYVKSTEDLVTGRFLQDYIDQVGTEFAKHHPLAVVTDMHTEMNADGSTTVIVEAVQPITPVMSLSERNTAKPME
jgi:hypothetical protein